MVRRFFNMRRRAFSLSLCGPRDAPWAPIMSSLRDSNALPVTHANDARKVSSLVQVPSGRHYGNAGQRPGYRISTVRRRDCEFSKGSIPSPRRIDTNIIQHKSTQGRSTQQVPSGRHYGSPGQRPGKTDDKVRRRDCELSKALNYSAPHGTNRNRARTAPSTLCGY
jgi:hypothetical protein